MLEWLWIAGNLLVGLPIALALVAGAREAFRAGVCVALGFRVFELHWGAGPSRFRFPTGPVEWTIRTWPIAGATLARSLAPRRHRLARAVCGLAPLLPQLLWLGLRSGSGVLGTSDLESWGAGPAPLLAFDLANGLLLALHGTLPVAFSSKIRTDARLFFDAALGHSDSDRRGRASYFARLARLHLERGEIEIAQATLERGLVQLGREPLLVDCQNRLATSDLSSVIDQGEVVDDWMEIIERREREHEGARRQDTGGFDLRRMALSAMPMTGLLLAVGLVKADALAFQYEAHLNASSTEVAIAGDPAACDAMLAKWSSWSKRSDGWIPLDDATLSGRHYQWSQLKQCRGDVAGAVAHKGESLLAANTARASLTASIATEPDRWLENELRVTSLFRQTAQADTERRAFRQALAALGKAERRLHDIELQIAVLPEPDDRTRAESTLQAERTELLATRQAVLTAMSNR